MHCLPRSNATACLFGCNLKLACSPAVDIHSQTQVGTFALRLRASGILHEYWRLDNRLCFMTLLLVLPKTDKSLAVNNGAQSS